MRMKKETVIVGLTGLALAGVGIGISAGIGDVREAVMWVMALAGFFVLVCWEIGLFTDD